RLLWPGSHCRHAEGSGIGGASVHENAGTGTRCTGEGLGAGLSGQAFARRRRPRTGHQTFSKRSGSGRRVQDGARSGRTGRATECEAITTFEGVLRMKRIILAGILALAAGASSLMAQGKPPAPKSQKELDAVKALFAAAQA